ncbi:MAG: fibronectin type III-like domain-contianing protein, partial [Fermentimonas sp.]|nr:fibronectin type III-like domain-contianing protein [Fermentimonas sp.]
GDYNPAGRLPVTFYKSTAQLDNALKPAENPEHVGFQNYNMEGRTYRYMKEEPLYPFGHGLSYSDFSYGEAQLSSDKINVADGVRITIPVTNNSTISGDEVVQVYVRRNDDPEAPQKSLRAFSRVNIKPEETKEIEFTIGSDAFEFYDERTDGLIPKAGGYTLMYGGTSAEGGLKSVNIVVEIN